MTSFVVNSNVEAVVSPFKGVLLDAYGVFWAGGKSGLIPGAKEAMKRLVASGKTVGVLSNTTQLARKEIDKLQKYGLHLGEHFHFFVSSGEIARKIFTEEKLPFSSQKKKFWLFGKQHPKFTPHTAIFDGTQYEETQDLSQADFIYVSIPHLYGEDQIDPKVFQEEVTKIKDTDIPMVCANPDKFAHEGDPPRAVVRQGSIAALFKEAGGDVVYMGKPEPIAYEMAMCEFALHVDLEPKDVLMVGDTPETDIRGAKKVGMASALVIQTGIMADRIRLMGISAAIEDCSKEDIPDFFVERLG
jgi:HAD superfamily hydrolase (TIGR01459 family)